MRKALPIFLFLSYPILLALFSHGDLPKGINKGVSFPYLSETPFTEDGFYMMTAAWNIAEGEGIKYNLNRPTTGIQPLFTFIQAALAKIVLLSGGDKNDFLRALILFSSLLIILFSFIVSKIVQQLVPAVISITLPFLLTLFCFDFFAFFNNGLETGFYFLMISVCVYYSFYFLKKPGFKSAAVFGILCGFTVLTRNDFLLPLFIYLPLISITKKVGLGKVFITGVTASAFLLPWLLYVHSVAGSFLPTSVSNQTALISSSDIQIRFYHLILAYLCHLSPFVYTSNFIFCLLASLIACIIFYYFSKRLNFAGVFEKDNLNNFVLWGISFLILSVVYLVYSSAYYFYIRYTAPFYLFIFIIASCFIVFLISKYLPGYKKLFFAGIVMLFFMQGFYYHFTPKRSNPFALRPGFISDNFRSDDRIGLFQSGVTGFFIDNAVNLDGKMDHVVRNYAMSGNFAGFIDSMNINILIEWEGEFNKVLNQEYLSENWKLFKKDIGDGRTECYVRRNRMENGKPVRRPVRHSISEAGSISEDGWEMGMEKTGDRRQKKVRSREYAEGLIRETSAEKTPLDY